MNIAIIGHEEKKFTEQTKKAAIGAIHAIIKGVTSTATKGQKELPVIVSGRSPLGGIDVWAETTADALKLPKLIFPAEVPRWEGDGKIGFKQRNIQIADASEILYVIVVATLPPDYPPEPWNRRPCYHCSKHQTDTPRHVKSGACWTSWYGIEQFHKQARWIVL